MLRRTNMDQELLANENQALEMNQELLANDYQALEMNHDDMEDEAETVIDVELGQQCTPENTWTQLETPLSIGQVSCVTIPSTEEVANPDDITTYC